MNYRKSLARIAFAVFLFSLVVFGLYRTPAQITTGGGTVYPTNYAGPTSLTGSGLVGTSSGLVLTITPGGYFCQNGRVLTYPGMQFTLLANTSYLVVANCGTGYIYAKTGKVGPGSAVGQPGVPNTILQAQGLELPIISAVAGASTLTLVDARVLSNLLGGLSLGAHAGSSIANGDTTGTCTLGTSCVVTFNLAYQHAPSCVATDTTAAAATKVVTTTTTATFTGTGTDVLNYICFGNPN